MYFICRVPIKRFSSGFLDLNEKQVLKLSEKVKHCYHIIMGFLTFNSFSVFQKRDSTVLRTTDPSNLRIIKSFRFVLVPCGTLICIVLHLRKLQ